jgi:asparagine synthase (glutamine-hydrolysing)
MIGVYLTAKGAPLPAPLAERFAASLAIGSNGSGQTVSFGGATLAMAPARRGWQPARTPRGECVLFKGWIDNRKELAAELCMPMGDDAALYAAGFAAWGDAIDLKAIGEFATIIVKPEHATIRAVRSPLSAPPLHVWRDGERTIIASAARAVFATGEIKQELDEQKIADSLFLNYSEGERGWFKGVSRIATGTRAIITPDGITSHCYYDISSLPDIRFQRDEDYVEAANALFEQATRAALNGFSRPAISVSGGYDSQAVAAFAMAQLPEGTRLQGYTSVPEPGWDGRVDGSRFGDERAHVEALAAMYPQMDAHFVDAEGLSFDHKQQALFLLGGVAPRNAMNLHWIHEVRAQAKAQGCDVVLTGARGNATFSFDGTGAIPGAIGRGALGYAIRELFAQQGDDSSLPRRIATQAIMPFLPTPIWRKIVQMRHGAAPDPFESWCPLNPEWADEMQVFERASDFAYDPDYRPKRSTQEWRAAVFGNAANEGGDLQQAFDQLHGVPQRDPTGWRPLVEFCAGIPDDQYLRNGSKRWLAKRMLKGRIPDMVLNETRRGRQAADWHLRLSRQRAELSNELDQLSLDGAMARRLNLPALKSALDSFPDKTPTERSEAYRLQLALSRGLTTARFIRYVEQTNR